MALTDVEETAEDSLTVALVSIGALAADGQFARLSLLADRLFSLSRRIGERRPYLSAAVEAFAHALQSRQSAAEQLLLERLGLTARAVLARVAASREQLDDILMATTLRLLLVTATVVSLCALCRQRPKPMSASCSRSLRLRCAGTTPRS